MKNHVDDVLRQRGVVPREREDEIAGRVRIDVVFDDVVQKDE